MRINLTRFFKFTGVVLALVAAGLLATAVHTAHEAGWWHILLDQAVDLSWLVKPGTVQFALITAMFGIQPKPTTGELLVWFLYAVPMVTYVLITPKPRPRPAVEASAGADVPAPVTAPAGSLPPN